LDPLNESLIFSSVIAVFFQTPENCIIRHLSA